MRGCALCDDRNVNAYRKLTLTDVHGTVLDWVQFCEKCWSALKDDVESTLFLTEGG